MISIEQARAEDAAWEAKDSTCRACPRGCAACNKDADCECYEHDEPEPSPIHVLRATEQHLSYPVKIQGLFGPVAVSGYRNPAVRRVHSGAYADCMVCIPRTAGRSLPNYRR